MSDVPMPPLPPLSEAPPPSGPCTPPVLPPESAPKPGPLVQVLVLLLSVCLGIFLADAIVSVVDDALIVAGGWHLLSLVRGAMFLAVTLAALVLYVLIGLTPMVPKRLFLPVALFGPATTLLMLALIIYFYDRIQLISLGLSCCELLLGVSVLLVVQGGLKLRWPLVPAERLRPRRFSWLNLCAFVLLNVFLVVPVVAVYLAVCASAAVSHFSEGFVALRMGGFSVQARKYVRNDGKTVHLVPMAHIGDAGFYSRLVASFPTNSLVLMEGVTDNSNLLTNHITYKRAADTLGLAEQHEAFHPVRVDIVMADVDVEDFRTNTIGFLNLIMLVHAKGLSPENVLKVLTFTPPPRFEEELFDDLLRKRNEHLMEELRLHLPESDTIVVPWGAAHMPGLSKAVQAAGFRLAETREFTVIRFGGSKEKGQRTRKERAGRSQS
jgi:hypothetical protein